MAVTRLKRKALRLKTRVKHRKQLLKISTDKSISNKAIRMDARLEKNNAIIQELKQSL